MPKKAVVKDKPSAEPAKKNVPDFSVVVGLAKAKAKVVIVDEYGDTIVEHMTLDQIARRHRQVDDAIDALEAEKEALKEAGKTLLIKANVKSVLVDSLPVTVTDGTNVSFSKQKYTEAGGDLDILNKSYKRTPFTSLLVKRPKEEEKSE